MVRRRDTPIIEVLPGGLVKWSVLRAAAILVLIALYACSDSSPVAPEDDGSDTDPAYMIIECPELSLGSSLGIPLDRVRLGRLPAELQSPLAARVTTEGAVSTTFTLVEQLDDGTVELVVPIHPSGSVNGGRVELTVTDGERACSPFDFAVAPLPPAAGTFDQVVDLARELVRLQAGLFGSTYEELRNADPAELAPPLIPLAAIQAAIDGPNNPNSLVAIGQGEAPILEGARLDRALLDGLLARTGIVADLELQARELEAPATGPSVAAALVTTQSSVTATKYNCKAIRIAEELDYCMNEATSAAFQQNHPGAEKLNKSLGLLFFGSRLVPVPAVWAAGVAGGTVLAMRRYILDAAANVLPSRFASLEFEADLRFREDEPGPGLWLRAKVMAASNGFRRDEALLDAVSPAIGHFYDRFIASSDERARQDLVELVEAFLEFTEGNGLLNVPPETFGPADISDARWSESDVRGEAIALVSHDEYVPRAVGSADLIVRTRADRFGSAPPIAAHQTVTVRRLSIEIEPQEVRVKANEILLDFFEVTVRDSEFPEMVEIDPSAALAGSAEIEYQGDGTHLVSYRAPASTELLPDLLTVRHTATTGARENSTEERNATAVIRGRGEIVITPHGACLEPGETVQFEAEVEGLENQEVAWGLIGDGTISSNGLYTAPSAATSDVVVTATSVADPDLEASVGVQVGGCSCWWTISVAGTTITSRAGDGANFGVLQGEAIPGVTFFDENISPGHFTGLLTSQFPGDPGIPVGVAAAFPVHVLGNVGVSPPDLQYMTTTDPPDRATGPATLSLLRNTGEILEGSVSGSVLVASPTQNPAERLSPFSASFRITADASESITTPDGQSIHQCIVQ